MSVRTDVINLNVNVNGNAAQNELNNLRKRAADVKLEMEGLGKRTKEFGEKKKELAEITSAMATLKQQIGIASLSQKELIAELNKLKALKGSVVPFSNEFKELQGQIEKVEARLYDVRNGVTGFASTFSKISDSVKQFGVVAAGYLGFQFITSQFTNIIQGAGKMSDQLADLRRVTGLSAEEVQHFNSELSKIDTRTSTEQLRNLTLIAGKLGVAKDDLLGFVQATDKLQVALGGSLGDADAITGTLGKILNVFDGHINGDNILKLGNAFTVLDNTGSASAAFMADFDQRLSGIAKSSGISLGALTGLGGGLEELGAKVESSATAIQKLIITIASDIPKAAKIAGQSTEDFDKLFKLDPTEALLKYSQGLVKNKQSFAEVTSSLKDAGEEGARTVEIITKLGGSADQLRIRINDGKEAIKDSTAITEAFRLKNETFGATLDKLGKEFYGLISGLTTPVKSIVNSFVSFIEVLKDIPKFISDNRTAIVALTGAFLVYEASVIRTTGANILLRISELAKAAYMRINAALTVASTVVTSAYTTIMGLLTGTITLQTVALRIWNGVIKANPLGAIIAVVTLAATVFTALTNKVKQLTDAQKLNAEVQERVADATAGELSKIKILTNVINDNSVSLDNRKKALAQLISINPQYLNGLTLENIKTAEGKKLLDGYVQSLQAKAEAEAKSQLLTEKLKKKNDALLKLQAAFGESAAGLPLDEIEKRARFGLKFAGGAKSSIDGVDYQELKTTFNQIDLLEKDVTASAKKNVEQALGGVNTIVAKSGVVTLETLEKQKKALEDARQQIDISNTASLQKNKSDIDKVQAQIDRINGRKSAGEKKADNKYEQELKEADKFYKDLLKLKEKAGLKELPQNDQEIEAVRQKYADLIARAKDFYIKKAIDKKKYGEEEALIEEAQRKEIDAIIAKHVKKQEEESAGKEYDDSLLAVQQYYDEQKKLRAEDFADGKLTKIQYDDALKTLDKNELSDRITVADNYSEHVKKAASDLVQFKKEQEKKTTADLIAETENRKKLSDEEKLAKAQRGVLTAKGKGVDGEVDAKKALLQTQFDLDTQYLDKKSELYMLKEAELQDALGQADDDGLQRKIQNVMQYVGYFSNALTSLNTILSNKENAQLAIEKKSNDAKKKDLKKQLDDKLISQAQYDKKTQAIDDDQAKHEAEVKRKQAIRDKALSIFNAVISNAQAIVTTMASVPFPFNIPLAIAQGIAGGLQIAAIKNQPLPELGTGEWIRTGDKHSDPSRGIPVKIERDEAVMNAAAMTDNEVVSVTGTTAQITSALNSRKGGGVAWAGGAQVTMPKWRTEAPAQINPGLVRYMATGGLGSGETKAADVAGDDETKGLIRQLISEQQATREEIKKSKDRLHAVVSIKEYREEEAKYDAAKNASSIAS